VDWDFGVFDNVECMLTPATSVKQDAALRVCRDSAAVLCLDYKGEYGSDKRGAPK